MHRCAHAAYEERKLKMRKAMGEKNIEGADGKVIEDAPKAEDDAETRRWGEWQGVREGGGQATGEGRGQRGGGGGDDGCAAAVVAHLSVRWPHPHTCYYKLAHARLHGGGTHAPWRWLAGARA